MAKIILLLTLLPLVELALLLTLGRFTSVQFTLGFVIITGITGALLLRYQGLRAYRNIQRDLAAGRLPTDSLLDGALILVAGVLLLTPGVLTDIVGMTLLIPYCRRAYRGWIVAYFKARWKLSGFTQAIGGATNTSARRGEVIDSYVVERDPSQKLRNNSGSEAE